MKDFIAPQQFIPFYKCKRAPRKFKKRWKSIFSQKYLGINQKLWYILGLKNTNYRNFLINRMIENGN